MHGRGHCDRLCTTKILPQVVIENFSYLHCSTKIVVFLAKTEPASPNDATPDKLHTELSREGKYVVKPLYL